MEDHLNRIKCPDCGFLVDDRAPACPQCGRKVYVETPADMSPARHAPIELPPPPESILPREDPVGP